MAHDWRHVPVARLDDGNSVTVHSDQDLIICRRCGVPSLRAKTGSPEAQSLGMLFRVCGPAWKTLGLLLDEQLVSRNKALSVVHDLAAGRMSEAECDAWLSLVHKSVAEASGTPEVGA